jgi:hypothetical protein
MSVNLDWQKLATNANSRRTAGPGGGKAAVDRIRAAVENLVLWAYLEW